MNHLKDRIKERREALGLTQQELASRLNTTKQAISKYENGIVGNLPLDKVQQLAEALNCTPAYLLGWTEEKLAAKEHDDEQTRKNYEIFKQLSPSQRLEAIRYMQYLASTKESRGQ